MNKEQLESSKLRIAAALALTTSKLAQHIGEHSGKCLAQVELEFSELMNEGLREDEALAVLRSRYSVAEYELRYGLKGR